VCISYSPTACYISVPSSLPNKKLNQNSKCVIRLVLGSRDGMGESKFRQGFILFKFMNGATMLWKVSRHILLLIPVLAFVVFLVDCSANYILIFPYLWIG
jgi:hypothetical protein